MRIAVVGFLLLCFSRPGFSQFKTLLLEDSAVLDLAAFASHYPDERKDLSLQEVLELPETQFKSGALNFGVYPGAVWIRVILQNESPVDHWNLVVDQPPLDSIAFYLLKEGKVVWSSLTGDNFPFRQRPVPSRNFVFPLILESGATYTCFIRVQGDQNIFRVPLSMAPQPTWEHLERTDQLMFGLCYGFLGIICLYGLLSYPFTGVRANFYYGIYVAAVILFLMTQTGHLYQYGIPDKSSLSNFLPIPIASMGGIFSCLFAMELLQVRRGSRIGRILVLFITLMLIPPVLQFFSFKWAATMSGLISLVKTYVFVVVSVLLAFQKNANARYVLPGWVLYSVGLSLFVFRNIGWLPDSFWSGYGLFLAVSIEVVILSVVITFNYRKLLQEHFEAQESTRLKELELENERMRARQLRMERDRKDRKLAASILENEQRLEQLASLKNEPSETALRQKIEKLIASGQVQSNYWENFRIIFEDVHPEFFERIRQEYPHLSVNDLRHLAYVKMNLQVKEISQLTGVSVQAVKMARNRLKKKINHQKSLAEIVGVL